MIESNYDEFDYWKTISIYQELSEEFIIKFQDNIDWYYISKYQILSEEFIRKFKDKVDWAAISCSQELNENFIREFYDKVDWKVISEYQMHLSENFIREFQDKVDWEEISYSQELSENFIREFQNKIYWKAVINYKNLSIEFIKDFFDKLNVIDLLRNFGYTLLFYKNVNKYQIKSDNYCSDLIEKDELNKLALRLFSLKAFQ